jgi:ABC-type uncharacterized transport system substrate-binding protein
MKRREFIVLASGAAAWPLRAAGQPTTKIARVAYVGIGAPTANLLGPNPVDPLARAFLYRLNALGYFEGQNLLMEWRSAAGNYERFPDIIRELIKIECDVIVTTGNAVAQVAKDLTQTIPIVMAVSANPVEEQLIDSLARPGKNITGLTIDTGPELFEKRVELLKEFLPNVSRVAFLWLGKERQGLEVKSVEAAAQSVGISILFAEHTPADFTNAFSLIEREHPDALLVAHGGPTFANRVLITQFAASHRLPAMYWTREFADAGGLASYGVDLQDLFRRAAEYVDRILKGAKPADLPVERPTRLQLVINLKTAKALGLTVPPLLIARADEVIE